MTDYIHSRLKWSTILDGINKHNGYKKYQVNQDGQIVIARDRTQPEVFEFFFSCIATTSDPKWFIEEEKRNFIELAYYEDIKQ